MEKGIKQGTREDLQGGGLVRSAGGAAAGLLGRKAEEREMGDARILGSGDFVGNILFKADKEQGYKFNDIAETLGTHPVTAGRCAEKGKKLVDNDDRIWNILEKRS